MARRRRKPKRGRLVGRLIVAVLALPAVYLLAALVGSLVPVNRGWEEPPTGVTVYLRSNGVHVDLIMPANAGGLDWRPLLPKRDFAHPPPDPQFFGFGAGERRVYLDTPRWRDLKPEAVWAGLTGGERVMHVEAIGGLGGDLRAIRLRPEEYRRLWAAVRIQFDLDEERRPQRIDHPGYWYDDAFYEGYGEADMLNTCNQWVADQLRIAGVETSLWAPFANGLLWRYRRADQST